MSKSVFCTATAQQAETIIRNLQAAGFSGNDISVLMADKSGTRDFAIEHNTKAPEGATTGAGTGAVVGGALGWLAGIGSLAIPGLGPFIAAGPILAALSGAAVGGGDGRRCRSAHRPWVARVRGQEVRRQGEVRELPHFRPL